MFCYGYKVKASEATEPPGVCLLEGTDRTYLSPLKYSHVGYLGTP